MGAALGAPGMATRQALGSATILLLIVTLCLVDSRLATAMVIPITVASLLSQLELPIRSKFLIFLRVLVLALGRNI